MSLLVDYLARIRRRCLALNTISALAPDQPIANPIRTAPKELPQHAKSVAKVSAIRPFLMEYFRQRTATRCALVRPRNCHGPMPAPAFARDRDDDQEPASRRDK